MAVYAWHYSSMACTLLGPQGEKARRIKMSNELLVPVLRQRCAAAVVMHVCMLLLAGLVTQYELNGLNSELGTFLVLACAGELARNAAAPPPPPPPPHHHRRAAPPPPPRCRRVAAPPFSTRASTAWLLASLPLAGCLFESLLSSYDLRGRVRQFIFFVMFMVV